MSDSDDEDKFYTMCSLIARSAFRNGRNPTDTAGMDERFKEWYLSQDGDADDLILQLYRQLKAQKKRGSKKKKRTKKRTKKKKKSKKKKQKKQLRAGFSKKKWEEIKKLVMEEDLEGETGESLLEKIGDAHFSKAVRKMIPDFHMTTSWQKVCRVFDMM